jgi:hypothetical protein
VELGRHHEILAPQIDKDAFRPGWMVKSPLLSLYESGSIDRYQYEVALWWRQAVERVGRIPIQKWG